MCHYLSVNSIPSANGLTLNGGKIGVLVIHGFTGSPVTIKPWAEFLNLQGYTVIAPCLPGHGSTWEELNRTNWHDWFSKVEQSYLELKSKCDRVFIAGFSMGAALAIRLCQIRGSEIEGLIVLNPSIHDRRFILKLIPILKYLIPSIKKGPTDIAKPNPPKHSYGRTPLKALDSLRDLWRKVERDLYLIDLPLMVAYSLNDHAVDPENSQTVIDNVYSADIREIIFEKSFHNVPLDYDAQILNDESKLFIEDVLSGRVKRGNELNERDLVDAEFDSIVSELSLDESAPTTYLDQLDKIEASEKFLPPKPKPMKLDKTQRISIALLAASFLYLILYFVAEFNIFGTWPAALGISASIIIIIWRTARAEEDFDDGATL
jgi:carboxylesterase